MSWLNHGSYRLKGLEEAVEICEVRAGGSGTVTPPASSEKAERVAVEGEPVLGRRPAVGQAVPNTKWVLEEKLGEGGFVEVWRARHEKLPEQRVFKFCFRADRVRSLKREVTLFRLLKERSGEHPNIVRLHDIYFDEPPYFLEDEYVAGKDLKNWCEAQGGIEKVPLATRLEIIAQAAGDPCSEPAWGRGWAVLTTPAFHRRGAERPVGWWAVLHYQSANPGIPVAISPRP